VSAGKRNGNYGSFKAFSDDISTVLTKGAVSMDKMISCEFNMDTACVELWLAGGTMIAIYTIAVENKEADNLYERSELDYLIYNAPAEYADLILKSDPVKYLKAVTMYKPFKN